MRRLALAALLGLTVAGGCGSDDETASEDAGKTMPLTTSGAAPPPPVPSVPEPGEPGAP